MHREQGFTLVELMVAMVVGSIAIASAYASYEVIAKQYEKVKGVTAMQSSSRSVMRMIERDIRMAGFKWRDRKGVITYGSISAPIKITDSGNKCCDAVTVIYDYRDEASNKVERHKIHYTVKPYQGRNRLYRKRDVLFPKARAGNNDVLADYVEDLQIGDPDASSSSSNYTKLDKDGKELPEKNSGEWWCVKDNKTGLIWEVKRSKSDPGWHSSSRRFRYQSLPAFTAEVNLENLCGFSNWRVPSIAELEKITFAQRTSNPSLPRKFFPNIKTASDYHTSTKSSCRGCYRNQLVRFHGSPTGVVKSSDRRGIAAAFLVSSGQQQATRLIMIDLILRTKKEFGPVRSYTKKSYAGSNYKINKNDAYKRQEYSSTVLIRNPL